MIGGPIMAQPLPTPTQLPFSNESERAVLGAVLLSPQELAGVSGRLRAEDFYSERHANIFTAMLQMQEQGVEIDLRTLQAKLEQLGQFQAVGGVAYLTGLDVDLPDVARVDEYVEIVKERSLRRRLIAACVDITRNCQDGGLEAAEALAKAEQEILAIGEEAIQRGFVSLGALIDTHLPEIEDHDGSELPGLRTGFIQIDDAIGGLQSGNLVIIAGRPGMGKTSFALNVAQHAAIREHKPVGIFSLEMSGKDLMTRILASEADLTGSAVRTGRLSHDNWQTLHVYADELRSAPIHIDDTAGLTLLELASKARRARAEKGIELLVLDYLQLMNAGGRYENRNLEIAAITRSLKQLSKDLDIPIIALSQLSRQPERRGGDHRPQLADLRESGSIEQDADIVSFIFREEVYKPDDPSLKGIAEFLLAKNRHGETKNIPLVFIGKNTTFKSRALQDAEPPF